MANTLDPMDLKQIITLHRDGESNRSIGSTFGISRNTVNHYMKLTRWRRHTTHVIARICNPCPQSTSRKVTHSKLKKVKNNSKLRNMSTKYKATATAEA